MATATTEGLDSPLIYGGRVHALPKHVDILEAYGEEPS